MRVASSSNGPAGIPFTTSATLRDPACEIPVVARSRGGGASARLRYSFVLSAQLQEGMAKSDIDTETARSAQPASTDLRMWVRLLSCAKIVEKRLRRNFQEQFDTTLPRFDVMAALDRVPAGLNMGALSRALLVSNGNVTSIVRQLQADGMVTAIPDPQDARSAIVTLTKKGKSHFSTLAAAHHGWITEALRNFPSDQQEKLLAMLSEFKSSLSEA